MKTIANSMTRTRNLKLVANMAGRSCDATYIHLAMTRNWFMYTEQAPLFCDILVIYINNHCLTQKVKSKLILAVTELMYNLAHEALYQENMSQAHASIA
jgi:hypothetical protein